MKRKSVEEYQELYAQALRSGDWNSVIVWATELLRDNPQQSGVWGNRGIGLQRLNHPLDAILNHQRALKYEETVNHYCNIGACYQDLDKHDVALSFFEKALAVDSTVPQIHMNMGHSYKWQRKFAEALEAYRQTTVVGPEYVDGHLAYAMLLLKLGRLEEGWKEFEWRWKSDQLPPRGLKFPAWNGEDLNDKTILVYGEQGLGDMIQFGRYTRILAQKYPKAKIIVECRQPVNRLLNTISEVYSVINYGEKVPQVDYIVAMVTLAGMLTPTIESIPTQAKQYKLQLHDIEVWKNRFDEIPEKYKSCLKVGLCWAGMARMSNPQALKIDEVRSLQLSDFAELAKIPNIVWVSLQKGPPADQLKAPPAGMAIVDYTEDMYDFYETCCAIENCDLVISVDTAVCHAAASIGKSTWMLSRWDGCWRWFGDREDSPWYPSMRQFVQKLPDNWDGTLNILASELTNFVESFNKARTRRA
jgi:tetratricopeptide (TPR) repeat protein